MLLGKGVWVYPPVPKAPSSGIPALGIKQLNQQTNTDHPFSILCYSAVALLNTHEN